LLSISAEDRPSWWSRFDALATSGWHFFACYNPFLAAMIEYQTGLTLPVIRLHGLYTDALYAPARTSEVLVVKGPNICVDSACLLNRFSTGSARPETSFSNDSAHGRRLRSVSDACTRLGANGTSQIAFVGLDELGGAPYRVLAAFRAAVLYPYDVALAIFYELYSMGMPLFVPRAELLPFYVFRGLHSHRDYHHIRHEPLGGGAAPGAGLGPPPFIPPLGTEQWFLSGRMWSDRTDFARFPHLLRFGAVAELLAALVPGATDWAAVSASMRRFNDETLMRSAAHWAAGVGTALAGRAGAGRASDGALGGYTRG